MGGAIKDRAVPVYLDYASTTPVDDAVIQIMNHCMSVDGVFGNPSSQSHDFGWRANDQISWAKQQVAQLINAKPAEIVFTSGATESINLALKGVAQYCGASDGMSDPVSSRRNHIVTMASEHRAVLETCRALEQQGFVISYLKPDATGLLDVDELRDLLTERTLLVSLLHVNNETGVIQDIGAVASLCRERGIALHVDASQSIGKLAFDVTTLGVDLVSFSAHKFYGPKGVGALYVNRSLAKQMAPQLHGGAQQRGLRAGTLATHQIVGMAKACEIAAVRMADDIGHLQKLYDQFRQGLNSIKGVSINGCQCAHYPGIINVRFADQDSEILMMQLRRFAISSGSACSSADREPSHVLLSMGLSPLDSHSSLRFSFGRYTSREDVEELLATLRNMF